MRISACVIKEAGKEIIPMCVVDSLELIMPENGIYEPAKFIKNTSKEIGE